ncbi:MAG: bifunctional riboflavin kinase/FAD synthetase [Actinobacteria bacterium]|uniref:Bifunctional riboflavin kinase/FMN adenylyltransferase n=1 Tax=freshwater metagenome TaxID=449393 RepID=A0A6J6Q6Y3_9ZZZZ|nr:bifunctional riboflavin kinase/FAD synthetase [Actinomycetota bacterium]
MAEVKNCVLIGIFDGVHAGHQELVKAAKVHGKVIALTFYPHPTAIFAPERTPMQLLPLADRISQLKAHGADDVVVIDFTKEFAALSPDEFIEEILIKKLSVSHVVVGENFTFGHKAQGTAHYLKSANKGFETTIVKLSENRGNPISSSRIRGLIFDGEVERASELLTRNHYLVGPVVHGEKRGREIGYPTANIGLDALACIPADGVYAGWLTVEDKKWAAAISIGTNPTFPGVRGRQVEAYAIDQKDLDLYDKVAKLEFTHRLRDTLKFDSLDSLLVQMKADCDTAAELTGFTRIN